MKIKKIMFAISLFMFFLIFPTKISAVNISYCSYDENLSLILPVSIGVDIEVIDLHDPFSEVDKQYYNIELLVHDEQTCKEGLSIPYIDHKNYLPIYTYYYKYNTEYNYILPIKEGVFSKKDITPPNISSFSPTIIADVDSYLELDLITTHINVFDETDGTLIPEITYDGYSDNFDKIGEYSIIFKACDISNNCSSLLQKIKVIDTTPPVIVGPSQFYSYISNPLTIQEIINNLNAFDNHDGNISNHIYVCETNYQINEPKTYFTNFCIEDSSNNKISSPFKVKIDLIDDVSPTIEGPTLFNSYLSAPLLTKNILSNIIVSDNTDLKASNNLYVIDDAYTKNSKSIGSYKLILGAYDCYGNESLPYIITINVIDDVSPIIEGETLYESYLSSPITIMEIKGSLIVIDNHDGNLFNKLEIYEDTYSNNKDILGIHYIAFVVTDSSNNTSPIHIVQIIVYDDIPPTIEGKNFYNVLNTEKLDVASIKLSLSAKDNIDGDISNLIVLNEDTYSENNFMQGIYFLTFYVIDQSGNISDFFKIKIQVSEDLSFLESINNSTIYLATSTLKNDNEILDILGINVNDYSNISTIENTYSTNYSKQGDYYITFQIQDTAYTKQIIKTNIKTYVNNESNNDTKRSNETQKKETIFSKLVSFIKSLFNNIFIFFRNLFS